MDIPIHPFYTQKSKFWASLRGFPTPLSHLPDLPGYINLIQTGLVTGTDTSYLLSQFVTKHIVFYDVLIKCPAIAANLDRITGCRGKRT